MPPPTPTAVSVNPQPVRAHYWRSETRRDQVLACVIGAACLAVAVFLQSILRDRRQGTPDHPGLVVETGGGEKSLSSLAATFPRLTLGGFRGLISTILWQQAEDDKNERRWIELETKYDIIGALQPYFVSVYTYHAWNEAYNISAQFQDEDTKYKWVLDGQAYLYKGEVYNPNNTDLIWEEGHMYFLKVGGAFERIFYREHWRSDIARFHELQDPQTTVKASDATEALKLVHDFVVPKPPENFRSYFNAEELPDPTGHTTRKGWGIQITDPTPSVQLFSERKDNKKPGDPVEFRYGLSPFYFAYVEYCRALQFGNPATMNNAFSAGWPAMALRMWCRDDLFYTGQIARELFADISLPPTFNDRESARVAEVHDCLRNIDMIAPKAIKMFDQNMTEFPTNKNIHTPHRRETLAYRDTAIAEGKLFDALVQWRLNNRNLNAPVLVNGRQTNIANLLKATLPAYDKAYATTMEWVDGMYPIVEGQETNPDRADFERYATAIRFRQRGIEKLLAATPTDKPDMSFLSEEVLER